jgi:cytochrome c oxidase assembly factor CtaG
MSHPLAVFASAETALAAWTIEPAVALPVIAGAALYLRGWRTLSRRMPERFDVPRLAAFVVGLAAIVLALCSPLDALAHHRLQAHMVQHLLLMLVAPPLLWLGAPVAPLLLGLPRGWRRAVARGLAARPVRRITSVLTEPRVAWLAFAAALWIWHVPALYELALRSDGWHHVEHACFFLAALAFWWPVLLPWPARARGPRWAMIAYLLLAEAQNMALSAILTFSDRVIYPSYQVFVSGRLSPIEDQALAGVIMWVPGSAAFTLALLWLVFQALAGESGASRAALGETPGSA